MRLPFRRTVSALLAFAASAAGVVQARAEAPLADKLPADALVYVGWRGADALGDAYAKSNLKGVIEAVELPTLFDALMKKAAQDAGADPKKLEGFQLFTTLGSSAFKYPVAVYFGGVTGLADAKPTPKLAAVIKCGGGEAPALAEQVQKALDANKNPDGPQPAVAAIGEYLLLTLGSAGDVETRLGGVLGGKLAPALSQDKTFLDAQTRTAKDAALTVFANGEGILKLIDDAVGAKGPSPAQERWTKFSDALGVDGIKYLAMTGGFDGPNWSSDVFVGMSDKRHGLLTLLDNPPLSDAALKMVPKEATWAGALRLNGDRILRDIRDAAARVDDNAQRNIDAGLQRFADFTGVDLEKAILANVSDELLFYGTDVEGSSLKGFTMVAKLKDGPAFEKAISDLEKIVAPFANRGGGLKLGTEPHGDLTVHVAAWQGGGFAWAVSNGTWVLALTPDRVQAAADFLAKGGPNIADNPAFAAGVKKLGAPKFSSFAFSDLAQTGPEAWSTLSAIVDRVQKDNPGPFAVKLPTFEKIKPFLGTMTTVAWSDADGFHVKSIEPFPGSNMLGGLGSIQLYLNKVSLDMRDAARGRMMQRRGNVDGAQPAEPAKPNLP